MLLDSGVAGDAEGCCGMLKSRHLQSCGARVHLAFK